MLISFRLADQEHEALYSLGQLLLFLDGWAAAPEWPESHFGAANLLVHGGRASLFSANPPEPTRYRELIGEATGADPHRMRLTAAAPPAQRRSSKWSSMPHSHCSQPPASYEAYRCVAFHTR